MDSVNDGGMTIPSTACLAMLLLSGCAPLATKEATVGCQIADAVTTKLAISSGAHELNPITAKLLGSFGWGGFFIWKAIITVALLRMHDEVSPVAVAAVNGATCLAAASNLRFIR